TNSLVEAAQPGQPIILWGTGLGAVSGNEAAGPLPAAAPSGVTVDVFVGGKAANLIGFGRSGRCAGVDQIAFTVPAGVEGCYVSVAVGAGGVPSTLGRIAVSSSGKICSDPTGFSAADLQKVSSGPSVSVADIGMFRARLKLSVPGLGTFQGNLDLAEGHFRRFLSTDLLASTRGTVAGLRGLPSLGSCAVSAFGFTDLFSALFAGGDDPVQRQNLDAGAAVNLNGPRGAKQLPKRGPDRRYGTEGDLIGGGIPGIPGLPPVLPDFLEPGAYTTDNGSGGPDVGAFRASLTIPGDQPAWTNQDDIGNVPRSQDLSLTWSGGDPGGFIGILGSSADPRTGAGAQFTCTERVSAG